MIDVLYLVFLSLPAHYFASLLVSADANNHIKTLDDELACKYDESGRQKEEITSLLGQLISQRHKIREVRRYREIGERLI